MRGKQVEPPRRVTDYFVKWKGYGPESNSWVREDHMDTDKLIEEFLAEHLNAVVTDHPQSTIIVDAKHKDRKPNGP